MRAPLDDPGRDTDVRQYLEILRARKWPILIVAGLAIGGALAFSLLSTDVFTSEARVLVAATAPPGSSSSAAVQPVNLDRETQIVESQRVASLVIDDLNLDVSTTYLLQHLTVAGITDSEVLSIKYSSTSARTARDVAESFASSYIDFRRTQAQAGIEAQATTIQARIQATSDELARVTDELQKAQEQKDEGLITTLESQRNALTAGLGVLQQRLEDVQTAGAQQSEAGEIIQDAVLPPSPSSPNLKKNLALAIVLGFALGIALAFGLERVDDRFKTSGDIESALQAPLLGMIPRFEGERMALVNKVVVASQPHSPASEAYRTLRTNLQFVLSQHAAKSALVTSAMAGEGKTVTAANLAVALAQAGIRTILVSADMRRPTLEREFGVSGRLGLSSWLSSSDDDIDFFVQNPGILNLRVMASGPIPPNPAELLSSPRLPALIQQLEDKADFVLVDSPPVLAVADPAIIATQVGGAILVVNTSSTRRSAALHARNALARAGGRLLGVVQNGIDASSYQYYGGVYSSHEEPAAPSSGNAGGSRFEPQEGPSISKAT